MITLITSAISAEDSPSLPTWAVVASATVTACSATRAASVALCAMSRIEAPICSVPWDTFETLSLTLAAAAEAVCAWSAACSAERDMVLAVAVSCSAAAATACAEPATEETTRRVLACASSSARAIWPTSSWPRTSAATVRSPAAIACSAVRTRCRGRVIERTIRLASTMTAIAAIATASQRTCSALARRRSAFALARATVSRNSARSFARTALIR